jgi:autotransporter-associated beta strand protein
MIGQGNPGQPGSLVSDVLNNSELIFNRVEDLTYAGSISGGGIVTKQAAGKLTLTGSNTYSGATNVNAGTLIVANSTGSATGSGPVNVALGATLAGTGTIAGPVTVNAGGSLAPGSSPGKLTFTNSASNALTWVMAEDPADSIFHFEINDAHGAAGMNPGWDALRVSQGGVVLQAVPGAGMTIKLTSLVGGNAPGALQNFNPYEAYVWPFIDTTLGFSGTSMEDINFVVDDAQFAAANGMATGRFSVIQDTPQSLALQFNPFDPCDFNLDGDVDGEDLAEWKGSFGPGSGADADVDGDSDGNDFLAWQRHLGTEAQTLALSAPVPEPSPCSLCLIPLLAVLHTAWSNRRT